MTSTTSLLGAAGEHFVMSELLRRGYIAALAPQGAPNSDIVVTDIESTKLCSIQVKTRRDIGSDGGWHMKAKHEELKSDFLFYCFVDFGKAVTDIPLVYILPSETVADVLREDHSTWLSSPGRNGHVRKDSNMRRFKPDYSNNLGEKTRYKKGWLEEYRNAWHLIGLK
ncbi:MAG: hypothetical protein WBD34_14820 [Burkholderiaceae bacterium]